MSGDPLRKTTSHLAAAVWFPTAVAPPAAVERWGAITFELLAAEAMSATGVFMRESLVLYRDDPPTERPPPGLGGRRRWRSKASSAELPRGYRLGLRYAVPLVEMPTYLPNLRDQVMRAGALVGDDTVFPVGGQIVRVEIPGLELSIRDEEHSGGRAYVHQRWKDCILGGTLEVGLWDTQPDLDETAAIRQRCADLAPALHGARVVEIVVGLRPGRLEVRLELENGLLPVPVIPTMDTAVPESP